MSDGDVHYAFLIRGYHIYKVKYIFSWANTYEKLFWHGQTLSA